MPRSKRPPSLTEAEVAALKMHLLEAAPRLERRHLLELADALYDVARDRRRQDAFDESPFIDVRI